MTDMNNHANIIDKVRKLFALATSSNIHEAAAAAEKAQELIERYALDEALIFSQPDSTTSTKPRHTETRQDVTSCVIHRRGKNISAWIGQLSGGIASVNRCRCWWDRGYSTSELKACGMPDDLAIVAAMVDHLINEVERLFDETPRPNMSRGAGKSWANSFKLGASSEIVLRLREAAKQERAKLTETKAKELAYTEALAKQDADSLMKLDSGSLEHPPAVLTNALQRVQEAYAVLDKRPSIVKEWMELRLPNLTSTHHHGAKDYGGYRAGREAGQRANLDAGTRKRLT